MTDTDFWDAIAAAPDDSGPKIIAADWYESRGDIEMAAGLRHCAENDKWPEPSIWTNCATPETGKAWFSKEFFGRSARLPPGEHGKLWAQSVLDIWESSDGGLEHITLDDVTTAIRWLGTLIITKGHQCESTRNGSRSKLRRTRTA